MNFENNCDKNLIDNKISENAFKKNKNKIQSNNDISFETYLKSIPSEKIEENYIKEKFSCEEKALEISAKSKKKEELINCENSLENNSSKEKNNNLDKNNVSNTPVENLIKKKSIDSEKIEKLKEIQNFFVKKSKNLKNITKNYNEKFKEIFSNFDSKLFLNFFY